MRTTFAISVKITAGLALITALFYSSATSQAQSRYRYVETTPKTTVEESIDRPAFEDSAAETFQQAAPRLDHAPQAGAIKALANRISSDESRTGNESHDSTRPRHTGALDFFSANGANHLSPKHRQVVNNEATSEFPAQKVRVASMPAEYRPEAKPAEYRPEAKPAEPAEPIAAGGTIVKYPPETVLESYPSPALYPAPRMQSQSNAPFQDQFRAFESRPGFQSMNFEPHSIQTYHAPLFGDECGCCDEWAGFCGCEEADYDCGCDGRKANQGHSGLKWLTGNDPCEGKKTCGLGGGCKTSQSNAGGLFGSFTSMFNKPSPAPKGCETCLGKLRSKTSCRCESAAEPACQSGNDCRPAPKRGILSGSACGCNKSKPSGCGCNKRN